MASLTRHELLTHTSGLPIWSPDAMVVAPPRALIDYVPRIEALEPRGQRGIFYSNAGFVLAEAALEAVTSKYYDEVLTLGAAPRAHNDEAATTAYRYITEAVNLLAALAPHPH